MPTDVSSTHLEVVVGTADGTHVSSALAEVVVGGADGLHVSSAVLEVVVAPDVDSTQVHAMLLEVVVAPDPATGAGGAGGPPYYPPGVRLWWALDVELAGVVYHVATTQGIVDGVVYRSGLADLELSRVDAIESSIDLEVLSSEDWPTGFAAAQWLVDGGPATLYLVVEERGVTRRILWATGRVDSTTWDRSGTSIALDLRPDLGRPTAPSPRERIDSFTRPATVSDDSTLGAIGGSGVFRLWEDSIGAYYPIIIGYPGHIAGEVSQCVVPAPVAQASYEDIVVDGGPDEEETPERLVHVVAGGNIVAAKVYTLETGVTRSRTTASGKQVQIRQAVTETQVNTGRDAAGQRAAWVRKNYDAEQDSGQPALFVGFSTAAGFGGGTKHEGRLVRGAADLFTWLIDTFTGIRLDRGRHLASSAAINKYLIDTWIDDSVEVVPWFEANVLVHLPAIIARGPEGIYLAHTPLHASRVDVTVDLVDGESCERDGPMEVTSTADVANELSVSWGPLRDGDSYAHTRVMTASHWRVAAASTATTADDKRALTHGLCVASQRSYGVRPASIEIGTVWDPATAHQIASDYLVRHTFPVRTLRYLLPTSMHWVEPGAVVSLTDADLALVRKLCVVVDVVVGIAAVTVSLRPVRTIESYF